MTLDELKKRYLHGSEGSEEENKRISERESIHDKQETTMT